MACTRAYGESVGFFYTRKKFYNLILFFFFFDFSMIKKEGCQDNLSFCSELSVMIYGPVVPFPVFCSCLASNNSVNISSRMSS